MTIRGGVNSIRLVQFRDAAYPFEQKGDEAGVISGGQFREEIGEGLGVFLAEVRRDLHAGEHDPGLRASGMDPIDYRLQIGPRDVRGNAAQPVIATELQHNQVDRLTEYPVDASQPPGGGLTAQSRIHHAPRLSSGCQHPADLCRVGLGGVDSGTGRQAVPKKDQGL